jgi:NADPH:quinone reductase-like Zn-dependent oxidoreductase
MSIIDNIKNIFNQSSSTTNAVVINDFKKGPKYQQIALPKKRRDEVTINVVATSLSNRVRSQISGTHYTSKDVFPLIPGVDGVGKGADGQMYYFLVDDDQTNFGSMAEQTNIDKRRMVKIPEDSNAVEVAAMMNPLMGSWMALKYPADFKKGQSVLVLGATGATGSTAVTAARQLGAGKVIAVGRHQDILKTLGADQTISLDEDDKVVAEQLGKAGSTVDIVLDFLWGEVTGQALKAIIPKRKDDQQLLTWVEIGSVAGGQAAIPGAALRAANLRLVGSGQGSIDTRNYYKEIPLMIKQINSGQYSVQTKEYPLAEFDKAYQDNTKDRIIFTNEDK